MKLCMLLLCFISQTVFAEAPSFRTRAHKLAKADESSTPENDLKAEIDFGRGLAARILSRYPMVDNPKLQQYVSTLGAGIAAQVGRPELKFHFAVVSSDDINAYACPGGYIFLTKGLMQMLSDEAQLVGVIGHEIAHVNEKHVLKKLKIKGKSSSGIDALGVIAGGPSQTFRVALQTLTLEGMNLLFEDGLSKSEEMDSDYLALTILEALGYQVRSYQIMLTNLKKSMKKNHAAVVQKTHPKIDERILLVDSFIKKDKKEIIRTRKKKKIKSVVYVDEGSSFTNLERFKNYVEL